MNKSYSRIGNETIITLKNYENRPMVIKNYNEKLISNDTGTFYMMTFEVAAKHNPGIRKYFIIRSDWFKNKQDLISNIKAQINDDKAFKARLIGFKLISKEK